MVTAAFPQPGWALHYKPPVFAPDVQVLEVEKDCRPGRTTICRLGDEDAILRLPADHPLEAVLQIENGRNVALVGGTIKVPPTLLSEPLRALYIKGDTKPGTVYIEGVLIDATGDDAAFPQDKPERDVMGIDAINVDADGKEVVVQQLRAEGISGAPGKGTAHGDVIQPWGGVAALKVDGLTGLTQYQGLFLAQGNLGKVGPVELHRVNIRTYFKPLHASEMTVWDRADFTCPGRGKTLCRMPTGYNLWLEPSSEIMLDAVYSQPAPGRTLGQSVWPHQLEEGDSVTFPYPGVSGKVRHMRALEEDFVPAGTVGVGYRSPYCDQPQWRMLCR